MIFLTILCTLLRTCFPTLGATGKGEGREEKEDEERGRRAAAASLEEAAEERGLPVERRIGEDSETIVVMSSLLHPKATEGVKSTVDALENGDVDVGILGEEALPVPRNIAQRESPAVGGHKHGDKIAHLGRKLACRNMNIIDIAT
ncbi:hypothetical protein GP486_006989 [Trichoglossum hirsutum]|uniref:Uncharacterized protein n=1 Tax=Trichoglossum hirsutum TaxID=265104 RepID=A0A9P8IGF1_9PEZI|nr:hypothetical protein GP486_006989 [Trichoglossum hirsutum]